MANQPDKNQQKNRPTTSKKEGRLKRWLINFFLLLLLVVGLLLVFNDKIKDLNVKSMTKDNQISQLTTDDIKKNQNKNADFNFDNVESLDFETIMKARFNKDDISVVGGIAIPQSQINLPIVKGVSNYALAVGAGTMKPDQEMGKGNYSLAGHHMINKRLLFSPLVDLELGEKIYITDLENIYEYTADYKEYVDASRVDLIEDVPDKAKITLVTCDDTGAGRLIVQGKFDKKTPKDQASEEMLTAFNLATNDK